MHANMLLKLLKYAFICIKKKKKKWPCKNMHIQILYLISWHWETNLFCTPLYLTIIKKSMQMLEVPKPKYNKYCISVTNAIKRPLGLLVT
jgi:hypothetical protein